MNCSFVCWTKPDLLGATFVSGVIIAGFIRAIEQGLFYPAFSQNDQNNSNLNLSEIQST